MIKAIKRKGVMVSGSGYQEKNINVGIESIQFFNKPNSKSFEFKVKKKCCGSCENCPFSIKNKS